MDGTVKARSSYSIGQTLDVSLELSGSPFTPESIAQFVKTFQSKRNNPNSATSGRFKWKTSLVKSNKDISRALGIEGSLNSSYGPVTGDVSAKRAIEQADGMLDVSLVVRATQRGSIVQNGLTERDSLRLKEGVLENIAASKMNLMQFQQRYGEWLIVGWEYGGEILFHSKYSMNSKEDKKEVEGALGVSFGRMGFSIGGNMSVNYDSKLIDEKAEITHDFEIFPSVDDPLINGADGVIPLLTKLSNPYRHNIKGTERDYKGELANKMQQFFSQRGQTNNSTNAVIIPLHRVSCVADAFKRNDTSKGVMSLFFKFANPLYMTIVGLLKDLTKIEHNYNLHDPDNKPTKKLKRWSKKLRKVKNKMEYLGTDRDQLYECALNRKRISLADSDDDEEDEKEELSKKFCFMDVIELEDQFGDDILKPYEQMMATKPETSGSCKRKDSADKPSAPARQECKNLSGCVWDLHHVDCGKTTALFEAAPKAVVHSIVRSASSDVLYGLSLATLTANPMLAIAAAKLAGSLQYPMSPKVTAAKVAGPLQYPMSPKVTVGWRIVWHESGKDSMHPYKVTHTQRGTMYAVGRPEGASDATFSVKCGSSLSEDNGCGRWSIKDHQMEGEDTKQCVIHNRMYGILYYDKETKKLKTTLLYDEDALERKHMFQLVALAKN